jgi:hypothetical protein
LIIRGRYFRLIPFRLQLLTKTAKATQTTSCLKAPGFKGLLKERSTLLSEDLRSSPLSIGMAKPELPTQNIWDIRAASALTIKH